MNPEKELELAKGAIELMAESNKNTDEVVKDAIINLLEVRDFLGHQLAHAIGMMTEEDLDFIADQYLDDKKKWREAYTTHDLQQHATTLFHILGDKLDLEIICRLC
jgi:ABC-type transport system involved in cytochrome c biogenesis ATPase subunit